MLRTGKGYFFCLLAIMGMIVGCKQDTLKPLEQIDIDPGMPANKAVVNFCTKTPETVISRLKFIFVLDKSGSNFSRSVSVNNILEPVGGTDMNGAFRYGSINNFLASIPDDELNVYYSLINFSTGANRISGFTNNKVQFQATVDAQYNGGDPGDGGWTSYTSAVNAIRSLIDNDIAQAQQGTDIISSNYIIFFLSDGAPIVGRNADGTEIRESSADILTAINGITALSQDVNTRSWVEGVLFHTGYYYLPYVTSDGVTHDGHDAVAETLLRNMAAKGYGDAFSFVSGDTMDFNTFRIPNRNIPYGIRDMFVVNLTSIWSGKNLVVDTDGDGISDADELIYGSNPALKDTNANGISDMVELIACTRPFNNSSGNCAAFSRIVACSISSDADHDLLNDCEEKVLQTSITNFDTNGDWIPDELAIRYRLPRNDAGGPGDMVDADQDSFMSYQEIKYNTPIDFNNNNLVDLSKQQYDLKVTSTLPAQTCYQLTVDNLKRIDGRPNTIRVYLMEKATSLGSQTSLRTAEGTITNGNVLYINQNDFGL